MEDTNVDFIYSLQIFPNRESVDQLRFIDARALAANMDQAANILENIRPSDTKLDLSKPLGPYDTMWFFVAAELIVALINLGRETGLSSANIEALKSAIPESTAWSNLIVDLSGKSNGTVQIGELNNRLKSISRQVATNSKAQSVTARDFKNDILLRYPSHSAQANYPFMYERFVKDGSKLHSFVRLSDPDKNVRIVFLDTEGRRALIGFSEAIVGSFEDSTSYEISATEHIMGIANSKITFSESILDPNKKQLDQLIKVSEEAVSSMVAQGDLGEASAVELKAILQTSAQALVDDPSSKYFGKGYSAQDVIEMGKQGILKSEGINILSKEVAEALQSSLNMIRSLDFAIGVQKDDVIGPDELEAAIEELQYALEEEIRNYQSLKGYADVLFTINAPEVSSDGVIASRENPAVTIAQVGITALAIVTAVVAIREILTVQKLNSELFCLKLEKTSKLAVDSVLNFVVDTLGAETEAELDQIVEVILDSETTNIEEMKSNNCARGYIQGLNCLETFRKSYPEDGTFADKKSAVNVFAVCLGQESKLLTAVIKQTDTRVKDLKKQSLTEAVSEFFAKIPRTATTVLTYAAYTALGLGVIWGAGKVYKALKSDEG